MAEGSRAVSQEQFEEIIVKTGERGEILRRAYEAINERADELALVMTLEMGKPLAESKAEINRAKVVSLLPALRHDPKTSNRLRT